jgi:hypothetical protein
MFSISPAGSRSAIDVGTADAAAPTELDNHLRVWPNDPAALARLAELQARD